MPRFTFGSFAFGSFTFGSFTFGSFSLASLACSLFLIAAPARAQEQHGSIEGAVKDASGGMLPGATVEARSPSLVGAATASTDAQGAYRFPSLAPGVYEVTATLQGFSPARTSGVRLELGMLLKVDLILAVTGVAETVNVKADGPIIDVKQNVAGGVLQSDVIDRIPKGRDFATMITSTPGVNSELRRVELRRREWRAAVDGDSGVVRRHQLLPVRPRRSRPRAGVLADRHLGPTARSASRSNEAVGRSDRVQSVRSADRDLRVHRPLPGRVQRLECAVLCRLRSQGDRRVDRRHQTRRALRPPQLLPAAPLDPAACPRDLLSPAERGAGFPSLRRRSCVDVILELP